MRLTLRPSRPPPPSTRLAMSAPVVGEERAGGGGAPTPQVVGGGDAGGTPAVMAERRSRRHIIIGSRKSDLAMWQAVYVRDALAAAWRGYTFEIQTEATVGDAIVDRHLAALATASSPGVFTKELEAGLMAFGYDLVVHSLKDMPTTLPPNCVLAAISVREDPRDVICIAPKWATAVAERTGKAGAEGMDVADVLAALPAGAVIGTSSLRREALLRAAAPHVTPVIVRGNLNTRFRKLYEGAGGEGAVEYDALLLAAAGVKRLGWGDRITAYCDPAGWPYGVGQGALGIETRADDEECQRLALAVCDVVSAAQCLTERAFLRALQGGCQVPIGVWTRWPSPPTTTPPPAAAGSGGAVPLLPAPSTSSHVAGGGGPAGSHLPCTLNLHGTVLSLDGAHRVEASMTTSMDWSECVAVVAGVAAVAGVDGWQKLCAVCDGMGHRAAMRCLDGGGGDILGPITGVARPITYGSA